MHFRPITSAGLALLLISGATATARDIHPGTPGEPQAVTLQRAGFLDLFRKEGNDDAPVTLAQADPRITQLEEEIRKLSGTIEELNFQVLQMQEQIRKMQEDNEFRFQQLEGGANGTAKKSGAVTEPAKTERQTTTGSEETTATVAPEAGGTGMPGVSLGTLSVDKDGNVTGGSVDPDSLSNGTAVAALPSTDDPDELYRNSYEFILSGDYPTAEAGFRDHITRFPADPKSADARYWLGEALLGQQKYREAAETFLAASKDYPKAAKAPDMLLKLGVSLKALNQNDVACATFREVGKRYPKSSDALKQRVKQEQALAAC
jgi:tol-pal system protein YbgF